MSFAAGLQHALQLRQTDVVSELRRGDSLEDVLAKHLLAVERMSDIEILTSVLLLSTDGKRLTHGAAPSLPASYVNAIDGSEIGPAAGSCGTAAYLGRPVYVTDIATDPLWAEYRDVALPHGLRSCWSTPILDGDGGVMGTFAIYHRNVSRPTRDELKAIEIVTDKVAQAINWARAADGQPTAEGESDCSAAHHAQSDAGVGVLPRQVAAMEALAAALTQHASSLDAEGRDAVTALVNESRKLSQAVQRQLAGVEERQHHSSGERYSQAGT